MSLQLQGQRAVWRNMILLQSSLSVEVHDPFAEAYLFALPCLPQLAS